MLKTIHRRYRKFLPPRRPSLGHWPNISARRSRQTSALERVQRGDNVWLESLYSASAVLLITQNAGGGGFAANLLVLWNDSMSRRRQLLSPHHQSPIELLAGGGPISPSASAALRYLDRCASQDGNTARVHTARRGSSRPTSRRVGFTTAVRSPALGGCGPRPRADATSG